MKGEKNFLPPEELKDCTTVGKIHAFNRRWRLYRPVCKEGVVLCGDAAGVLDPAAGQGIFNALMSGMMAGETVLSCLKQPEMEAFHLARYDSWFVQHYEEKAEKLHSYYMEQVYLDDKQDLFSSRRSLCSVGISASLRF
jgi:flavin-dependent dehydrogenase